MGTSTCSSARPVLESLLDSPAHGRIRLMEESHLSGLPRRLTADKRIPDPRRESLRTGSAADGKRERDQGLARRNASLQQIGSGLGFGGPEVIGGPAREVRLGGRERMIERNQREAHSL